MTPAAGRALIAAAKRRAIPVAACVTARLRPDRLLSGCSWEELAALVVVLAEAHDPARLRVVCDAEGDRGLTASGLREFTLRTAHFEFNQLREAGYERDEMPAYLSRLESEYQREARQRKKLERGGVAA